MKIKNETLSFHSAKKMASNIIYYLTIMFLKSCHPGHKHEILKGPGVTW